MRQRRSRASRSRRTMAADSECVGAPSSRARRQSSSRLNRPASSRGGPSRGEPSRGERLPRDLAVFASRDRPAQAREAGSAASKLSGRPGDSPAAVACSTINSSSRCSERRFASARRRNRAATASGTCLIVSVTGMTAPSGFDAVSIMHPLWMWRNSSVRRPRCVIDALRFVSESASCRGTAARRPSTRCRSRARVRRASAPHSRRARYRRHGAPSGAR